MLANARGRMLRGASRHPVQHGVIFSDAEPHAQRERDGLRLRHRPADPQQHAAVQCLCICDGLPLALLHGILERHQLSDAVLLPVLLADALADALLL